MAELERQGSARPPDFGRLSQSGGEDPDAKIKGIYNIHTYINQKICRKFIRRALRFPTLLAKLLENSKLALVCCSDEWRGWVSSNSPNSESCTPTSPFFH